MLRSGTLVLASMDWLTEGPLLLLLLLPLPPLLPLLGQNDVDGDAAGAAAAVATNLFSSHFAFQLIFIHPCGLFFASSRAQFRSLRNPQLLCPPYPHACHRIVLLHSTHIPSYIGLLYQMAIHLTVMSRPTKPRESHTVVEEEACNFHTIANIH